jgi:16S rRNA (adenine1518-N6/adenine1519-N6)-dimethyltransferase
LFKLLREAAALAGAVLMMQQEVGDRLLARPGTKDYGILSVLMQYSFALERLFRLSPANFYPPPQVSSVVLKLTPANPPPRARDEALFTRLVKAAFGQRRKKLLNALAAQVPGPEGLEAALREAGIDPQRRGETLSVAEFVALSNAVRARGWD